MHTHRHLLALTFATTLLASAQARAQHAPRPRHRASTGAHPASDAGVLAAIRAHIRARSPVDHEITRSAVDLCLEHVPEVLSAVRSGPSATGSGLEISDIPAGHPLGLLGLRNGDVIDSVGGYSIDTPARALVAYAALRSATTLPVVVRRGARAVTLTVRIVPG